jgi:hypothetical protein
MTSYRLSRRASLPSLGGTTGTRDFRSHPRRVWRRWAWGWSPGSPGRDRFRGNGRISCVPEEPPCALALLSDPGRSDGIRPLRCPDAAPTASTAEAPACIAFEAQSHGFGTGCLRFAGRVTPTPRKTRFRLPAKLFRAGLVTRRVPPKGFTMYPTLILLSQVQRSARTQLVFPRSRRRRN